MERGGDGTLRLYYYLTYPHLSCLSPLSSLHTIAIQSNFTFPLFPPPPLIPSHHHKLSLPFLPDPLTSEAPP